MANATPAPGEWSDRVSELSAELGLRRSPAVLAIPGNLPPMVLVGPRLVLPVDLLDRLTDAQRDTLLVHELTHLKRGDHWVRVLETVVSVGYWWLPVVGWIGRRMRASEEACCDAAVIARRPEHRRAYARLLLDVLDFADPLPRSALPVTAVSVVKDMERRLTAILAGPVTSRRSGRIGMALVLAAVVVLPVGVRFDANPRPVQSVAVVVDDTVPFDGCGIPPERVKSALCCPS
jgi:beta-lactamase regulating signal transducer with metallopeptidase domain